MGGGAGGGAGMLAANWKMAVHTYLHSSLSTHQPRRFDLPPGNNKNEHRLVCCHHPDITIPVGWA